VSDEAKIRGEGGIIFPGFPESVKNVSGFSGKRAYIYY
jgi:hypothetical protein